VAGYAKRWIALISLFLLISACGYSFVGRGRNPYPEIRTVHVKVARNRSVESSLEAMLTDALRREFSRHAHLRLGPRESADALVSCEIIDAPTVITATVKGGEEQERRITLQVSASFVHRATSKTLWSEVNLRETDVFVIPENLSQVEGLKKQALQRAAERMAAVIYNRIFARF